MIRLVKRLHRAFKRLRHARAARPRLEAFRPEIERVCGGSVSFKPTEGGGHDFVFYVCRGSQRAAVLRIANGRHVPEGTPLEARLNGPRLRLTARERIAREHRICAAGAPHGLTPAPLWLSEAQDAAMNSYVAGDRLLTRVQQGQAGLWDAIAQAARRGLAFHAAVGEAHMDLSLLNVLADRSTGRLTLIDFELAPNPALSPEAARLFDFLNLVEMAYTFMSAQDRQEAPRRLERLFSETVPARLRQEPVAPLSAKLPRILSDPLFRDALAPFMNL